MPGKKFRFSLEPVLALRRKAAERAERGLANALRARQDREQRLGDAEDALRALRTDADPGTEPTPASFRRFAAAQQEGFRARTDARDALTSAQRTEEQARRALVAARQPEEALTTLRDDEEASHRATRQHAERATLDDQATAAYCRKRRGQA